MPGKKYASIKNPKMYEAMRRHGMSKEEAARRSNAMATPRKKSTAKKPTAKKAAAKKKRR